MELPFDVAEEMVTSAGLKSWTVESKSWLHEGCTPGMHLRASYFTSLSLRLLILKWG